MNDTTRNGANPKRGQHEFNTPFLSRSAEEALYGGITVDVACDLLHINDTELRHLIEISDVAPCGQHGKSPLYQIYDLASLVVPPHWTDEEWEDVLSKRHFPAQLVKDFWNAKKARQDYLLSAGDMWHTSEVVETLSEALKTVAMGVKLITDNLDRETTLTPRQREVANELVDSALQAAANALQDKFEGRVKGERTVRFETLTSEKILNGDTDEKAAGYSTQPSRRKVESEESSSLDLADL